MFKVILVAIDRSQANQQVFEEALILAKATKAKLILLHVLSEEEPGSPIMSLYPPIGDDYQYIHLASEITQMANQIYHKQWKNFETEGLNILRSFASKATAAGIETEFTQVSGHSTSSTICDFAQSCHAEVIVIGRRGYSGLKEMLLGSVSNYVIHHAPCFVLLVQTFIQQKHFSAPETLKKTTFSDLSCLK